MENLKSRPSQSPSMLHAVLVAPDGLRTSELLNAVDSLSAFETAWEFLGPSVERSGENTKEFVLASLSAHTKLLWLNEHSAVITEMLKYPSGLSVVNGWIAGGDPNEIVRCLPLFEEWGRARGATEARVSGRRGWARVFGYREFRSVMKKDLTNV